jgi:RimJ/RimL family protein N-acetyltransferase
MGLRSLGPVWSRPTIFGHGVPMSFPGSPATGPGFTEKGRDLVRLCDELGILIDLSHLNEKSFDDVAEVSTAPLVATHSNAHALCDSPRNLTDRQLHMIRERGGMVGFNFATFYLNADGTAASGTGWDVMLRHLDHLIAEAGEDHGGLARGLSLRGGPEGRVVGTSASVAAFHRSHPRGGCASRGLQATDPARRGQGIALHLGARALIEMKERHGIDEVFTGIRAGNGPSEKLCAKLGLRATDFEILLAIATDVLGAERVTKSLVGHSGALRLATLDATHLRWSLSSEEGAQVTLPATSRLRRREVRPPPGPPLRRAARVSRSGHTP